MAKKAKRRGRPPSSKNKSTLAKLGTSLAKMDVGQLRDYIAGLNDTLAAKVQQQREYLESQLAGLQVYASNKAGAAVRAVMRVPRTRQARAGQAEVSKQESQTPEVVRPRTDAGVDARGDEGYQAHEGRFSVIVQNEHWYGQPRPASKLALSPRVRATDLLRQERHRRCPAFPGRSFMKVVRRARAGRRPRPAAPCSLSRPSGFAREDRDTHIPAGIEFHRTPVQHRENTPTRGSRRWRREFPHPGTAARYRGPGDIDWTAPRRAQPDQNHRDAESGSEAKGHRCGCWFRRARRCRSRRPGQAPDCSPHQSGDFVHGSERIRWDH